jgi:SH3-like domain-containing protein
MKGHSCQWTVVVLTAAIFALAGCERSGASREPVLAVAFTGPVKLDLRAEISPKSGTVTTTRHGEKLEVLQVRRRFIRVRAPNGKDGWTEMRNLLAAEQIDALADLAQQAAKLPSQGEATVYSTLNIHAEPNRLSTSFYQLTEGRRAEVVGHELVPRTNKPSQPGFEISKPKPRARRVKQKKEPKYPPPPKPAAPAVPSEWVALSRTDLPPTPEELAAEAAKSAIKVPVEDWSLVRTKDGKAGWVLTRNLVMAIPDEVAQYSEGARITSYFDLADVPVDGQMKHHWLWTTMRNTGENYDFDSFRIFVYVARRHRYETALIERKVEGYYPVMVTRGAVPKFSLILRGADGTLARKTYVLEGYNVRKIADEPWVIKAGTPGATTTGKSSSDDKDEGDETSDEDTDTEKPSLFDRLKVLLSRR